MKYVLTKTHFYMGASSRTSYGISIMEEANEMPGVIESITDISENMQEVNRIVEYCNNAKVSIAELSDIVEIFLK